MPKQDNKGKDRMSLRERICKSFDLQPDIFNKDTLVEIRSKNKVTVRGAVKILSYSPTAVRMSTGNGELHIGGKRLFCSSYSNNFAEIDGLIISLCFEEAAQ